MAKRKLRDRSPRLAAIRTLLLAEMIVIEEKRDEYIELGFGRVDAPPEMLALLNEQIALLGEASEALRAFDRLGD